MMRAALLMLALAACSPQSGPQSAVGQAVAPEEVEESGAPCWYGGCDGPFYSAAPARFGRFEVGDVVPEIPDDALTRSGDCASDADEFHCSFTLSDGVEYLIYRQWVARKRITLSNSRVLPFGLSGDESQAQLVRRLSEVLGVEASVVVVREGRALISHEGTLGTLESPMWLYFELDESGRLSEITWQGPPTV
ncbi:MAG: hypothetical protein R3C30_08565 [Hyphomonadaceae bacterium]